MMSVEKSNATAVSIPSVMRSWRVPSTAPTTAPSHPTSENIEMISPEHSGSQEKTNPHPW